MTAIANQVGGTQVIVLVCGGRKYNDREHVFDTLDRLQREIGPFGKIVHGDATGADALADEWGRARRLDIARYRADWNRYKKGAGPIRNREMLAKERPTHLVAFPGNNGTADMVKIARAAGVVVIEIDARPQTDTPEAADAENEAEDPSNPFLRAAMGRHRG